MPFSNLFLFLSNINFVFRSFVLGTVFSTYAMILYYFAKDTKLGLSDLSYTFVIPFVISAIILLIVPKRFESETTQSNEIQDEIEKQEYNERIEIIPKPINTIKSTLDSFDKTSEIQNNQSEIKEAKYERIEKNTNPELNEKIKHLQKSMADQDQKISNFEKQVHELKITLQDLKRSGVIKNDNYESALTELKAFKSELDNPFNFINKYFEMLNVPGMYDQKTSEKFNVGNLEFNEQNIQQNIANTISNKQNDKMKNSHNNIKYNKKNNDSPENISDHTNNKKSNNKTEDTIFRPKKVNVIG